MGIYILGEGKLYCNKCYLSNGLRCDQNKTFSTCRRCPELIDMPFYCYERQYNISATQMISERDCIRKDFYEANWPCFPNLLACKVRLLFLLNTLSTNSTKWSNALKQFLGYWTFFVWLALRGLIHFVSIAGTISEFLKYILKSTKYDLNIFEKYSEKRFFV